MFRKMLRTPLLVATCLLLILTVVLAYASYTTQAQSTSQYFPETQHNVKGIFLKYWQEHGGLTQQGYPLTEEFQEKSKLDGKTYTVQYFERAVFELHPEYAGTPSEVLLSQLGKFELNSRYPNNGNPTANPAGTPGATVGDELPLQNNVTITLTDKYKFGYRETEHTSGLLTVCGSKTMYWVFQLTNYSNNAVSITTNRASLSQKDDTGKTYALYGPCGDSAFENWSDKGYVLPGGQSIYFALAFDVSSVPSNATYFAFTGSFIDTPISYQYPVAGISASPTPAAAQFPYCTATALTAKAWARYEAQLLPGTIEYTNISQKACTLEGYPTIQVFADQVLKPTTNTNVNDAALPVQIVTLQPGGRATNSIRMTNWCGAPPQSSIEFKISLTHSGGTLPKLTLRDIATNNPILKVPECDSPITSRLQIGFFSAVTP